MSDIVERTKMPSYCGTDHCEEDRRDALEEIIRLREENIILKRAVGEEGRANRMTLLYESEHALVLQLQQDLLVATNRLKNAEGALADAGTYCDGITDVTNGINRLGAVIDGIVELFSEQRDQAHYGYDEIGYYKLQAWDSISDEVKDILKALTI